jgi:hypothetical protein
MNVTKHIEGYIKTEQWCSNTHGALTKTTCSDSLLVVTRDMLWHALADSTAVFALSQLGIGTMLHVFTASSSRSPSLVHR